MNCKLLTGVALATVLVFSTAARAQSGAAAGATTGAVVGAGMGAVAGGIADDTRPRFRSYVTERRDPLIATTAKWLSVPTCRPAA
jgi:hypothetical protein